MRKMLPDKELGAIGLCDWPRRGTAATPVHPSQTIPPGAHWRRSGEGKAGGHAGNGHCHIGWAAHDASGARMSSGAQAPIDGLTM